MDNELAVILLIENELYGCIEDIKKIYTGKEADEAIKKFKETFKETVLKRFPVENIDELIDITLRKMNKNEKEIAD